MVMSLRTADWSAPAALPRASTHGSPAAATTGRKGGESRGSERQLPSTDSLAGVTGSQPSSTGAAGRREGPGASQTASNSAPAEAPPPPWQQGEPGHANESGARRRTPSRPANDLKCEVLAPPKGQGGRIRH